MHSDRAMLDMSNDAQQQSRSAAVPQYTDNANTLPSKFYDLVDNNVSSSFLSAAG